MILVHKKLPESPDSFNIEGILLSSEPMWRHTTFAVGGPAEFYAVPSGESDLGVLMNGVRETGMKYFILGGGSNLLVADAGIRGLIIDMREFREFTWADDGTAGARGGHPETGGPPTGTDSEAAGRRLVLGAGLEISDAAWRASGAGRGGLDVFFGMPGSVGGAVWMNARCYGGEISELFAWADVMERDGRIVRVARSDGGWEYKTSPFQERNGIILRAAFDLPPGDPDALRTAMREKRDDREAKGHFRRPCAGSAFKNNRDFGAPSGALIDDCGLKGFRVGGAAVSDWHGNIIINDRGARAEEIHELLNQVASRVEERTGYAMEREVRSVGDWPE